MIFFIAFFIEVIMTWVILEGLDRTGKSTVANIYKKQDYEIVHMSAPDKKYTAAGYTGPSYVDDVLELLMKYDGVDTVWDRSWYGEAIWPHVYGRTPQLTEDDVEMLQEFEGRNSTERILMVDPDQAAHWQRCVINKELLNPNQFRMANSLFAKMAHKYNFSPRQLKDFADVQAEVAKPTSSPSKQEAPVQNGQTKAALAVVPAVPVVEITQEETELAKLEKANAIRDVLSKPIFKSTKKDKNFEQLEEDIRGFLKGQLTNIFSEKSNKVSLSEDEITILKMYCQQLKDKVSKK